MTSLSPTPVIGDAFGHILARCWAASGRHGVAFQVVERDDGYIGVTDAASYFASPTDWSPAERWACEQAVGRVLDIGCGAGRHAIPLGQAGHDVIGLDTSPGGPYATDNAAHLADSRQEIGGDGDMRHLPMVGCQPVPPDVIAYLVVKQDNNGDTFIITDAAMPNLDKHTAMVEVPRLIGA